MDTVFSRRTYLRRALLGGGLAWLALFLLCFGIASIDYFGGRPEFWDTLSRTQLSTDEAYLAFGRSRTSTRAPPSSPWGPAWASPPCPLTRPGPSSVSSPGSTSP